MVLSGGTARPRKNGPIQNDRLAIGSMSKKQQVETTDAARFVQKSSGREMVLVVIPAEEWDQLVAEGTTFTAATSFDQFDAANQAYRRERRGLFRTPTLQEVGPEICR